MFKGLILAAKGWFRAKAEDATDLRLAGREHIFNVNQSIEAVRAQRNEVAGKGIILEERIANLEKEMRLAAKELAFEKAAKLRDKIKELKKISLM